MSTIYLRINTSGPASLLVEDTGVLFLKSITDNAFDTEDEFDILRSSEQLATYLSDDVYGVDSSTILMSYTDNGAALGSAAAVATLKNLSSGDENSRRSLEEMFSTAYNDHYTELSYTGDNLTGVDIWENNSKTTKLFTRTLNYSGDNLIEVVTTDEIFTNTLTVDLIYSGDNLDTITKTAT